MGRVSGNVPVRQLLPTTAAYMHGFHKGDPGGLAAIDTDMVAGNIADGVTIFGVLGTLAAAPTPTYDRYYTTDLAVGAFYTPNVGALFSAAWERDDDCQPKALGNTWEMIFDTGSGEFGSSVIVGDGSRLRFYNFTTQNNIVIMRYVVSGGTYEREYFTDLAGTTRYTPAVSGIFSLASESALDVTMQNLYSGSTWWESKSHNVGSGASVIGDGTNFSVYNSSGSARQICLMRAKPV